MLILTVPFIGTPQVSLRRQCVQRRVKKCCGILTIDCDGGWTRDACLIYDGFSITVLDLYMKTYHDGLEMIFILCSKDDSA